LRTYLLVSALPNREHLARGSLTVQNQYHEEGKMGKKFLQNAHHDRTENRKNASGTAMERGGSLESPRQVDVTRQRSATRCFAVVANKIDGGGRTRQRCQKNVARAPRPAVALPHIIMINVQSHNCGSFAGCVGRVLRIVLNVDVEIEGRIHVHNSLYL
jgi:hypothetical protein